MKTGVFCKRIKFLICIGFAYYYIMHERGKRMKICNGMKYLKVEKYQKVLLNGQVKRETDSKEGGYSCYDKNGIHIFVNDLHLLSSDAYDKYELNYVEGFSEKENWDTYEKYIKDINIFINMFPQIEEYQLVFRRKRYTKILEGKISVIPKYEIKIKYKYNNEKALINYGISGTFERLKKTWNYRNLIIKRNELFEYPFYNIVYRGNCTVLLGNAATGFLCHEAIGHMAEADFVVKGSGFNGLLGRKIFNNNVTIVDCGNTEYGAGNIDFDDEGVSSKRNIIVDKGVLNTYLTNKKLAEYFNIENTGNARSSFWDQDEHIRMTNTYLESGNNNFQELISQIEWGFYISETVTSGNCRMNGKFEIAANNPLIIQKGHIIGRVKKVKILDDVFKVFNNFYGIGNDSKLCLGTSSCGKYSSIKVDAGGPHVLTECYVEVE